MGETLSYTKDEKSKLESEVPSEEFIRIMKDFKQRTTKDLSNPPSTDPRTPIVPIAVSPALTDSPSVDLETSKFAAARIRFMRLK